MAAFVMRRDSVLVSQDKMQVREIDGGCAGILIRISPDDQGIRTRLAIACGHADRNGILRLLRRDLKNEGGRTGRRFQRTSVARKPILRGNIYEQKKGMTGAKR